MHAFYCLTIDRNSEEEFVGDVNHYTAQEVQSIHMAWGVREITQDIQVLIGGTNAHTHCPLQTRAC